MRWKRTLVLAVLALAGCGDPRPEVRTSVEGGDLPVAAREINRFYGHHLAEFGAQDEAVEADRQLLLWRLERGLLALIGGDRSGALDHLKEAARLSRDFRTRSVVRAATAAVTNDNLTRWTGEPAEIVRIPYYGLLAHLDLSRLAGGSETAGVHADRAASAAIALEDQLRRLGEGEFGKTSYVDDGWLHAVAAVGRSVTAVTADDHEAARQYAARARTAYGPVMPAVVAALMQRISDGTGPGTAPPGFGSVLVIEEAGWVPLRRDLGIYVAAAAPGRRHQGRDVGGVFIWTDDPDPSFIDELHALPLPGWLIRDLTGGRLGVFGCEIPVLPRPGPALPLGRVEGAALPLEAVNDVEGAIRRCFAERQPARVAAIIVRTVGKLILANQGGRAVTPDAKRDAGQQALRDLLWLLTSGLVTASEQADTRCWSLLPARVGAALVHLPPGRSSLTLSDAAGGRHELGPIEVVAGSLTVVLRRTFPPPPPGVRERTR